MSQATRRKIEQLRALAASTTFPEEAKSARAKADQLEASLGPEYPRRPGFKNLGEIPGNNFRHVGPNVLTPDMMDAIMKAMQDRVFQTYMDMAMHGFSVSRDGERIDPAEFFNDPPPRKEGKSNG